MYSVSKYFKLILLMCIFVVISGMMGFWNPLDISFVRLPPAAEFGYAIGIGGKEGGQKYLGR